MTLTARILRLAAPLLGICSVQNNLCSLASGVSDPAAHSPAGP